MNHYTSFLPYMGMVGRFKPSDMFIFFLLLIAVFVQLLYLLNYLSTTHLIETPMRYGTLHEGTVGIPLYRNPLYATNAIEKDLAALIHAGLLRRDGSGQFVPYLAEAWTQDSNRHIVMLRDTAFFHNGVPVTSSDVVATVAMAQEAGETSPYTSAWSGVTVEAVDETTVVITVPEGNLNFPEALMMPVLPEHVWKKIPVERRKSYDDSGAFIGAGPYEYREEAFTLDGRPTKIMLTEFPGFVLGRPYIQTVVFHFFLDTQSLVRAYRDGTINTVHSVAADDIDALLNETEATHTVREAMTDRVFGIFFNTEDGRVLQDPFLRSILSRWVSREEIVSTVFYDHATVLQSPIASDYELNDRTARVEDLEQTLEDIGWKFEGSSGQRIKDGIPFSISLVHPETPETDQIAKLLAEGWRRLGITVETRPFPSAHTDILVADRDFDVILHGYGASAPKHLVALWKSSEQRNIASLTGYGSPILNTLLSELEKSEVPERYAPPIPDEDVVAAESDSEEERTEETGKQNGVEIKLSADTAQGDDNWRKMVYDEIKVEMIRGVPAAFLYSPHFLYILPKEVQDDTIVSDSHRRFVTDPSDRFTDIHSWYIRKEKVWRFLTETPHSTH